MEKENVKKYLQDVASGTLSVEEALEKLQDLPYSDLGFAKVDFHRGFSKGETEVIYCPGKTNQQIIEIFNRLAQSSKNVIATRAESDTARELQALNSEVEYNERTKMLYLWRDKKTTTGIIGVVSAGTADIPVAEEAALTAEIFGNTVERIYDVGVAGLHRLLDNRKNLLNCRVLIVVAGMEGALASVVGGLVKCPIIAVPTGVGYGASFHGLAALLSMLNSCSGGIGTVNIDNGFGAGVLAHRINQIGEKHD